MEQAQVIQPSKLITIKANDIQFTSKFNKSKTPLRQYGESDYAN